VLAGCDTGASHRALIAGRWCETMAALSRIRRGVSMRPIVAAGLAACLLAAGCSGPSPHRPASPPSVATAGPARKVPSAMLVWTPGRLPAGFAARAAALPGVRSAVAVVSGTVWLGQSLDAAGQSVDRPPAGMAIPLDLAGAAPQPLAPFLPDADRSLLAALDRGEAILGATSARLRRLGPGATLRIGVPGGFQAPQGDTLTGRAVRVAGVVPDQDVGGHELLVSRREAATLGQTTDRYLLVEPAPGTPWQALAGRLRALLPSGARLRIRGPGQAAWLRQGDAVLPQALEKALLGEFVAKPLPAPGGWITIDPAWVAGHIVTAQVPILGQVTCNRAMIPQLHGALAEVVRRGLGHLVDPGDYAGCYAPRVIAGDPGPSIAHHAWGSAIDLNARANPQGLPPHQDRRLVAIFERWGFTWGGRWLVPDAMHFELLRLQSTSPS
jgi:D-alanyl-D-alanine carboxypeptidase